MVKTILQVGNEYIDLTTVRHFKYYEETEAFYLDAGLTDRGYSRPVKVSKNEAPEAFSLVEDWLQAHVMKPRARSMREAVKVDAEMTAAEMVTPRYQSLTAGV